MMLRTFVGKIEKGLSLFVQKSHMCGASEVILRFLHYQSMKKIL